MKKYLAPEFEEVKYDVIDCLTVSGDPAENENNGSIFDDLPEV